MSNYCPLSHFFHNLAPCFFISFIFSFLSVSPYSLQMSGLLPIGEEPWFSSVFLSLMPLCITQMKDKEGTMLPPGGWSCNCTTRAWWYGLMIVSVCLLGDGSSQGQDRSSWETEEREMSDCEQQHLSQLNYTDLFCFFNLERIFWQFCNKLAILGSAFLQRPHTVLYSSAWQPDFGFIVQSNNLSTRKWPLIFDLQQEAIAPSCNGFMSLYLWGYVKRPWWHWWCKLFFGTFREEQRPTVCGCFSTATSKRLYAADGFAKCSHSVAPPIRPFAWTDLMWIQRTQLWAKLFSTASFKIWNQSKIMISFFLFYKLWILCWWHRVIRDIEMTLRRQCRNLNLPNIYFVNKNLPSPPYLSLCAIR